MKIQIPEKANRIIAELGRNGYEAYAVGGCVRDSILGKTPEDWDITTSAPPWEVKRIFRRTVDTGFKHGTVTVLLDKEGFEVTTYRIDGEYEDGRHPKEVCFTGSLKEDLRRRDFTINAMAYNETAGLVDLFGGEEDLKNRLIRCVGSAGERFDEDALRILRAVRFCAQLGFSVEEETLRAAGERAEHLRRVSAERIRAELNKILLSEYPQALITAKEQGITAVILPEFDRMLRIPELDPLRPVPPKILPNYWRSVGRHALETVNLVCRAQRFASEICGLEPFREAGQKEWSRKERQILRWAAFLHDVGKPDCKSAGEADAGCYYDYAGNPRINYYYGHEELGEKKAGEVLRRLKFDNETIECVQRLVRFHNYNFDLSRPAMRRSINEIGEGIMELLFELRAADILKSQTGRIGRLAKARAVYEEVIRAGECTSLKTLAVNGSDLIAAGYAPGKELGSLLSELLSYVLDEPGRNTKEALLAYARERKRE